MPEACFQHDEEAVLCAVEMALEAGVPKSVVSAAASSAGDGKGDVKVVGALEGSDMRVLFVGQILVFGAL